MKERHFGKMLSGEEKYREHLAAGFSNEQAIADVFKWYGSKEKAMEAIMQLTGDVKELKQEQGREKDGMY